MVGGGVDVGDGEMNVVNSGGERTTTLNGEGRKGAVQCRWPPGSLGCRVCVRTAVRYAECGMVLVQHDPAQPRTRLRRRNRAGRH